MQKLLSHQPMQPGTPTLIIAGVGMLQAQVLRLGLLDRRFEGKTESGKCVWLTDGRRVEFDPVAGGGFIAALSNEPDPEWPGKEFTP